MTYSRWPPFENMTGFLHDVIGPCCVRTSRETFLDPLPFFFFSPEALQSLFTKSSPVYNFRRKMISTLPKPRSDILKKSVSYQAAALWNSLDNSTLPTPCVWAFPLCVLVLYGELLPFSGCLKKQYSTPEQQVRSRETSLPSVKILSYMQPSRDKNLRNKNDSAMGKCPINS